MKEKLELAKEINKDVISVLISILDTKTDAQILFTTDSYLMEYDCEYKAISVGFEIKILGQKYIVDQLNLSFETNGLTDLKPPVEYFKGVFNPFSAILTVYVTKKNEWVHHLLL
jgi:hypothetical protein